MGAVDHIGLNDLNKEQRQIAELIGIENYKSLIRVYGGISLYIPKPDNFEIAARNTKIRSEFNGYNYKELAQENGLTEVTIRNIVADIVNTTRCRPHKDQISMFES